MIILIHIHMEIDYQTDRLKVIIRSNFLDFIDSELISDSSDDDWAP